MKYVYQMMIILLFTFLGEVLAAIIPFPIPAAIWGLLLLFLALLTGMVKVEQIKECSGFLVAIMPMLFVAPTVNLMDQGQALLGILPAVIVIVVISTLVTFLVAGQVTQLLRGKAREEKDNG